MRFIQDLCPPALLYLIFLAISLGLDLSMGLWVTALLKSIFGVACVVLLDVTCDVGLTPVSWAFVTLPFIVTALATSIAMGLELDRKVSNAFQAEHFLGGKKYEQVPIASNEII